MALMKESGGNWVDIESVKRWSDDEWTDVWPSNKGKDIGKVIDDKLQSILNRVALPTTSYGLPVHLCIIASSNTVERSFIGDPGAMLDLRGATRVSMLITKVTRFYVRNWTNQIYISIYDPPVAPTFYMRDLRSYSVPIAEGAKLVADLYREGEAGGISWPGYCFYMYISGSGEMIDTEFYVKDVTVT